MAISYKDITSITRKQMADAIKMRGDIIETAIFTFDENTPLMQYTGTTRSTYRFWRNTVLMPAGMKEELTEDVQDVDFE